MEADWEIRLSVRRVCEFLLRSGSIDNRFGGTDRAAEGSRIHRRLQKEAREQGLSYRAEVLLRAALTRGGRVFRVQGRADGILFAPDGEITVDEIKTTARPLELIPEDFDAAHWGQAIFYGYLFLLSLKNPPPEDGEKSPRSLLPASDGSSVNREGCAVQLRYVQADTQEIKTFLRRYSFEELERFVMDLLDRYAVWADYTRAWHAARTRSIADFPFPFPRYRAGQRPLAVAVYRTVQRGGRLFCQAPTGVGKTVSTLFPAVKAMGEGMGEKIFYLTAKAITRRVAAEALDTMRAGGLRLKSVVLTAKDKICPQLERDCNPESCPFADGYYDRVNGALYEILQGEDCFGREAVEAAARKYRLCPFELSLDLSEWCDAVIGDYNHLFDPVASLKRYFTEGGDYTLLIDEAHNLVDRSRGMYSAYMERAQFGSLRRAAKEADEKGLARALNKADGALRELGKTCPPGEDLLVLPQIPEEILPAFLKLASVCDDWLAQRRATRGALRSQVLEFYFSLRFFLRIAEICDEHYAVILQAKDRDVRLELCCLDASALLDERLSRGRAAVFFSATLSPAEYFISVLGGGADARKFAAPSPFEPANLCLLAADRISTRYADRQETLGPVARLLGAFAQARGGRYLFFFPSYRYLRQVHRVFASLWPQLPAVIQEEGASEEARADFLARFEEPAADARGDGRPPETLIGFCVLGGVFSEGIDLRGDRLIGAAVVGVGLPQVNARQEILRGYYDRVRGSGFDFAYRFPGMNKVLQAAGRVIRGASDRGAVLLIDSRFTRREYRALYPAHWAHLAAVSGEEDMRERLRAFWNNER